MSREKKWTPGPWECGGKVHEGIATFDNGQYNVYPPLGESGPIAEVGGKENADLISAAPELVSELEEADATICVMCKLLNPQHRECTSCPDRESRLAALAKAYGETP